MKGTHNISTFGTFEYALICLFRHALQLVSFSSSLVLTCDFMFFPGIFDLNKNNPTLVMIPHYLNTFRKKLTGSYTGVYGMRSNSVHKLQLQLGGHLLYKVFPTNIGRT